jgi:S-(hydroxymethyl)glutathione dehydrogenase/alcohol dehydrogenase
VIGAGGVGLSTLMGARLRGAGCLIAADVVAAKLERARALGRSRQVDVALHYVGTVPV